MGVFVPAGKVGIEIGYSKSLDNRELKFFICFYKRVSILREVILIQLNLLKSFC